MDLRLKTFLDYYSQGLETVKTTFEEAPDEVWEVLDVYLANFNSGMALVGSGCLTLLDTWLDIDQDLESSIYLALSARYLAANAILRRVFEVELTSLYFDIMLHREKGNEKSRVEGQRKDWLSEGKSPLNFAGESGVIDTIFGPMKAIAVEIDGKDYAVAIDDLKDLYGRLSKFVHKGPSLTEEHMLFNFAECRRPEFSAWAQNLRAIQRAFVILMLSNFPAFVEAYHKEQTKLDAMNQSALIH
jgi:hypothetical protein